MWCVDVHKSRWDTHSIHKAKEKYHLNTLHVFMEDSYPGETSDLRQTSFSERRAIIKSTADRLTDTVVKQITRETVDWLMLLRKGA